MFSFSASVSFSSPCTGLPHLARHVWEADTVAEDTSNDVVAWESKEMGEGVRQQDDREAEWRRTPVPQVLAEWGANPGR